MNKLLISSIDGDVYSVEKGSPSENKIPIMTSNTAPEGIASASSVFSTTSYPAWRAFNGDTGNLGWISSNNSYPQWLSYEFSSKQEIEAYSMVNRPLTLTAMPKDWLFEGSDDGINWEVLDERTNVTDWEDGVFKTFVTQKKGNYKKYRIFINSNNGYASYVAIAEVQMMSSNPSKIKQIPSQTEQDFIGHGMEITQIINPQEKVTQKQYINNQSTILGNGKVFEQPIDKYIKSLKVE